MTNVDLEPVCGQVEILRWVKARQAELKELETAARGAVEEVMGNAEVGTLDDKPVVKWSTYKKRQFDQKALKEHLPELAEEYTDVKEVRRFELLDDDE
jgi:predicted phage-related endonuclease